MYARKKGEGEGSGNFHDYYLLERAVNLNSGNTMCAQRSFLLYRGIRSGFAKHQNGRPWRYWEEAALEYPPFRYGWCDV